MGRLPFNFMPPWKPMEKSPELVIVHWTLFAPGGKTGLYETSKELMMAENEHDDVYALLVNVDNKDGGDVDIFDRRIVSHAWNFAYKWADVQVVHVTIKDIMGRLQPRVFCIHGTPEACLYAELSPDEEQGRSFTSAVRWIESCDASVVFSKRHEYLWKPFDHSDKLHYIPKGVDLARFHPDGSKLDLDGDPNILYGEIYRKIKDPFLLLYALKTVHGELPKMQFHPWGLHINFRVWNELFVRGKFSNFLGKYGLSGQQTYPEHWFRAGDMLVSTSIWGEPSRVALEAHACGCPVIMWDTTMFDEDFMPTATAKAFDPEDLAREIIEIYYSWKDNPELHEKDKQLARQWVEQHADIKMTAREFIDLAYELKNERR